MVDSSEPLRSALLNPLPESSIEIRKAVTELTSALPEISREASVSIGIVRNITIEPLEPTLRYRFLEDGIVIDLSVSGFGSMQSELRDPGSAIHGGDCDLLVTAVLPERIDPGFGAPGWRADDLIIELDALLNACEHSPARTVLVNNFPLPSKPEAGSRFLDPGGSLAGEIERANRHLSNRVQERGPRFRLLDWSRMARHLGHDSTWDERGRFLQIAPFRRPFLDAIAVETRSAHRALTGKIKKCLVLDCDNTLWGGVLGEDGPGGVRLDAFDYPGRAYFEFQKTVMRLKQNGIVICVCSKNDEPEVLEFMGTHPWCLLRPEDLAAHRINWNRKSDNLRSLAEELNLGLESFVFVDDNPRELGEVKASLPMVTTLQVPDELHQYPGILLGETLFDKLALGDEDAVRTELYQQARNRRVAESSATSVDAYLTTLEQVADIHEMTEREVARVAELTQKTNQFNLTTKRYTGEDIRGFMIDPMVDIYAMNAEDRFGSLGLIGVLIARVEGSVVSIDTMLMSCRALGRNLEPCFALYCLNEIRQKREPSVIRAQYTRTARNGLASGFWDSLGLLQTAETDKTVTYELEAGNWGAEWPVGVNIRTPGESRDGS